MNHSGAEALVAVARGELTDKQLGILSVIEAQPGLVPVGGFGGFNEDLALGFAEAFGPLMMAGLVIMTAEKCWELTGDGLAALDAARARMAAR